MRMVSRSIKIERIDDIKTFIKLASRVNGDINVSKGIYIVDGKSAMGLMSIDLSSGVRVEYFEDGEGVKEFESFLDKLAY
jgi:phosphotransferase system HPr-like phosphotransfer protein